MTTKYRITGQNPSLYLDARNNSVQGFTVYFELIEYAEQGEVRVPSLNPKSVQAAIEKIVNDRDALAMLGTQSGK